jgi:hypothetical protein
VASTTAVTNFNADMVDGKHAADLVAATDKGAANGIATLDAGGKLAAAQAPLTRELLGGYCTGAAGTAQVISVTGLGATAAACNQSTAPGAAGALMTGAGTVKNLYVNEGTSQKNGTAAVWTVYKNNVATTLTCTVPNGQTACNDQAHSFTVAAGDYLTVKSGTTASSSETLANVSIAMELWK